jgi:ParB family transcriptional regulator, chromosome partitioning protein
MQTWTLGEHCELSLGEIRTEYACYRVPDQGGERAMHESLQRYGQISPLVCWLHEGLPELLDGFKRLHAAHHLGMETLAVRWIEADARLAKAAVYGLNCVGGGIKELEEAWIVHALVREDRMTQVEVAELLGRHKSWVCRRLQMIEKLSDQVLSDLRLGLLTATAARQLVRLPDGNQDEVLEVTQRDSLTAKELEGVVDLWLASPDRSRKEYILADPRQAVLNAKAIAVPAFDPRLSTGGNRVSKRLGMLLDLLTKMHNWIRHRSGDDLLPTDLTVLLPSFERLVKESVAVAEICEACLLHKEVGHE